MDLAPLESKRFVEGESERQNLDRWQLLAECTPSSLHTLVSISTAGLARVCVRKGNGTVYIFSLLLLTHSVAGPMDHSTWSPEINPKIIV